MSYLVHWDEPALDTAAKFLVDDPDGLRRVFEATDLLASDPRPPGTVELGSRDLRRMRVGQYRVMYEIIESTVTVMVLHLGRKKG
ncbi:type II toxin-antitoxin system RelE family toxin [Streptomyces himalayensis]|uniref:Type II toxin-antitoxin system RelE/ParE family toxin n=1 Tax=Streptomyces himalayensis subsp. himalayensis TaxID=2756131 RepID=A0A7W0DS79_9ACTN|nr:type II toxin-antitoxin system RelE/ParE family toxin [Streptomyces himalayensis]MBA2949860.1 type II toxin-antitoxin system RelE/ParE family toxin [Streptomyces himalayensis subsp. himalayensis]